MTTRPGWIRRVRAVVTGDTTDDGTYRLHVDDGQPTDRDYATAAALIANARADADAIQRKIADAAIGPNLIDQPDILPEYPPHPAPRELPITRAYPPPSRNEDTMPTSPHDDRIPVPAERPLTDMPPYPNNRTAEPDRTPRRPPADFTPITDDLPTQPDPLTDSGIHHVPDPDPATTRVTCTHCEGTGYTMRTVSELLRESIALIPADGGQTVIREFYRRLLTAAPDLAPLFPADLITAATDDLASPGRMQRDKLLQALAALADLYGTSSADRQRLDTALRSMGRSHAAFARPDGTVRGATIEEYMGVKQALMDTLHTAAADAWRPEYDAAWSEAYDYAAVTMLHEQMTSNMTMPRYPRPNQ